MMKNIFEEIKKRMSLLEYTSKVMQIKPYGKKHIALCPFHSEKTASFQIDQDLFYCFGCHVGGDLFEFYEKFHKVSKKEALENLAQMCGVELYPKKQIEKNSLIKLKDFFYANLKKHNIILDVLHERGINDDMIAKFEIGYSSNVFEIREFLKKNNLNLSLYGFNDYFWPMFEKRIVFPIYDFFNNLVSFGGRIVDQIENSKKIRAKYINGAASANFNKSEILYGSNFLKKGRPIYITEGYIDVILLYQNGFNAVAPMGTAFSEHHLKQIWEYSNELIVAMDGDDAGFKSALKIAHLSLEFLQIGKKISFIRFENGEDVASFLQKGSELSKLKKYELYEYLFINECNWAEKSPDRRAVEYKKLMDLCLQIKDPILQKEYRKNWKDLWWSKKKKIVDNKYLISLDFNTSVLLLFKYVLMYPDILDDVCEYFIKLPINKEYNKHLMDLLNNRTLDKEFLSKINSIRLKDDIVCTDDALIAWRKIAQILTKKIDDETNYRLINFENDFSSQEWEKFKKWIANKEVE